MADAGPGGLTWGSDLGVCPGSASLLPSLGSGPTLLRPKMTGPPISPAQLSNELRALLGVNPYGKLHRIQGVMRRQIDLNKKLYIQLANTEKSSHANCPISLKGWTIIMHSKLH